jgi:hypothetical protein
VDRCLGAGFRVFEERASGVYARDVYFHEFRDEQVIAAHIDVAGFPVVCISVFDGQALPRAYCFCKASAHRALGRGIGIAGYEIGSNALYPVGASGAGAVPGTGPGVEHEVSDSSADGVYKYGWFCNGHFRVPGFVLADIF